MKTEPLLKDFVLRLGYKRKKHRRTTHKRRKGQALWIVLWLLGVGAIVATASVRVVPGMERHMLADVQQAIGPLVTSPVMVSVHGHRTTITGDTSSEAERESLIAAIQAVPGVRAVVDRLSLKASNASAPASLPAATTAPEVDDEAIPATTNTQTLAESAAEPPAKPDAEPEPSTELAATPVPTAITTSATTSEDNAAANLLASTDRSSTSLPSASENTTPAQLSIRLNDQALTLEGALSNAVDTAELVKSALTSFEPSYLTNRIESTATDEEADWLEPLTALLPSLRQLKNPSISARGRQITLAGVAGSRDVHDDLVAKALETLTDFALVERITVADTTSATLVDTPTPDAGTLTTKSDSRQAIEHALESLDGKRLQFLPNSAEFIDGSAERLNAIAQVFNQHPDAMIEIEGHTDTSGDAEANLLLSQQRATTVREALVDRGVSRDRLVAYGYGEGIPLVDNATPEGRARNRRIEFRIKPLEEQP